MSMRSYEDQIWREDQWYRLSLLADGLVQLAEGAKAAAGRGVPPMDARQLAEATGDYEAIGWTQREAETRAKDYNDWYYRMADPYGSRYQWYARLIESRWTVIRHLGNSGKAIIEGL